MKPADWLQHATETLKKECHNPRQEARWLFEWSCEQCNQSPSNQLSDHSLNYLEETLSRRASGEPLAYILGSAPFWTFDLIVNSSVLIPRQDTETLVEWALKTLAEMKINEPRILDLGTGSGAIALALASELPSAQIHAVDLSSKALDVAKTNQMQLKLPNIKWHLGSWFEPVEHLAPFDLILSNPPYIDETDPDLSESARTFEPATALFSDNNGLADIELIAKHSLKHLRLKGQLGLEHGFRQGPAVSGIMKTLGYTHCTT